MIFATKQVQEDILNNFTRDHAPKQTVCDTLSQPIGRMPRIGCEPVSMGLETGEIPSVTCVYSGKLIHAGTFKHGGPQLVALYHLLFCSPIARWNYYEMLQLET